MWRVFFLVNCNNVAQYPKPIPPCRYDACGICNGTNTTCAGCDGVPNSGLEYDACGVCGGREESCKGCDGYGGGVVDICGVCRGDGSTCGGCDGKGNVYDDCGVCGGDDSTCSCVNYHGYHLDDMNYLLLSYIIDQTLWKVQHIMDTLILTMEVLETYSGPADLGVMIEYFNNFCEDCIASYSVALDKFTLELEASYGLLPTDTEFNLTQPYTIDYPQSD